MHSYILSAFADEYSPQAKQQIEGLIKNGIGNIEVRGVNSKNISELTKAEMKDFKAELDDSGIGVSAIGSPLGKIGITDDFEPHKLLLDKMLDAAVIFNAPNIRIFSFYIPEGENATDYRGEVLSRLEYMINRAEKRGVRLCHENEGGIYGESPENCLDLFSHFKGRLGCAFDMGNFEYTNYDALAAYAMLKDYIDYFHIKDAVGKDIVKAGSGNAKIYEILKDYAATGKNVFLTLEPHLSVFNGLSGLVRGENAVAKERYSDKKEAFFAAANALKDILHKI